MQYLFLKLETIKPKKFYFYSFINLESANHVFNRTYKYGYITNNYDICWRTINLNNKWNVNYRQLYHQIFDEILLWIFKLKVNYSFNSYLLAYVLWKLIVDHWDSVRDLEFTHQLILVFTNIEFFIIVSNYDCGSNFSII